MSTQAIKRLLIVSIVVLFSSKAPAASEKLAFSPKKTSTPSVDSIMNPKVRELVEALGSDEWRQREEAANNIRTIGLDARGAIPALIERLEDEQWHVHRAATNALSSMGPEANPAVPSLTKALTDEEWQVRKPAAEALAAIGPASEPAVSTLIRALDDEEWHVRKPAAEALAAIGPASEPAIPTLIKALDDEEWQVRKAAAQALGAIGLHAAKAIPALKEALDDFEEQVCNAAVEALKKITKVSEETGAERQIALADVGKEPRSLSASVDNAGTFTWLLPPDADAMILPISGGLLVETSDAELMRWLREGSPWNLMELPVLGARYGDRILVVIAPWPHYVELIVDERLGIRFSFPTGRFNATPCRIVVMRCGTDPLCVARAFRQWTRTAEDTGVIPRPRSLAEKANDLPRVSRLFGAPHIYLWGLSQFSRHDVDSNKWKAFAAELLWAKSQSIGGKVVAAFTENQRKALRELAGAEWPARYLVTDVAAGIQRGLLGGSFRGGRAEELLRLNRKAFAAEYSRFVHPPETWGDGMSHTLLDELRGAGIDRALLLLNDLYEDSPRADVAAHADKLGYLLGPYDSYHCVHSPTAGPDDTWETAQHDLVAFEKGRVINADGSGHTGFRGEGFQFSPQVAWPYMQQRVDDIVNSIPYSTWFIDCDATAECFDDYSPEHPATKPDDTQLRRHRLSWLESKHNMVVGSEGGAALFSDVIHYGHGVHTPYIGHLDPAFRDQTSPHFVGRYWPPDTPEISFKPIELPLALKTPYFDPGVRIPLYQAALGDEVIVSHHGSFDSFKLSNMAATRELLEILYMVPPMYHLNREAWPKRRERIIRHVKFWAPLHRELAQAPLTHFEWLSDDRLVQRTKFRTSDGEVALIANFGVKDFNDYPAHSVTAEGDTSLAGVVYHVTTK